MTCHFGNNDSIGLDKIQGAHRAGRGAHQGTVHHLSSVLVNWRGLR